MNECCKWSGNGDWGFVKSCKGKIKEYCPYCGKRVHLNYLETSWENCNKPTTYGEWKEKHNG